MGAGKRQYRSWRRSWVCAGVALLSGLGAAGTAHGLVTAAGTGNTDGTGIWGWDAVGRVNFTGTYLGNGWVLGPRHAGYGGIVLDAGSYGYAGMFIDLTNANGSATDLMLFRVAAGATPLPAVTPLSLATSTPMINTGLKMISYGPQALNPVLTYWNTNTTTWAWSTSSYSSANIAGYTWASATAVGAAKNWGGNVVDGNFGTPPIAISYNVNGPATTSVFTADFYSGFNHLTGQPSGGTTGEAVAISGDSGGAVLAGHKLVGVILATNPPLTNQPANSAIFSPLDLGYATETYIADIATYTATINLNMSLSEWTGTSPSGEWSSAGRWNGSVPNAAGATVHFLEAATTQTTVTVGSATTVGAISFNNTNGYVLSGAGSLTFDNTIYGTANPGPINTLAGSHTIAVPLTLAANLNVTTAGNSSLLLSGAISETGGARSLGKYGPGTLILASTGNSLTGGITVGGGMLVAAAQGAVAGGPIVVHGGGLLQLQSGLTTGPAGMPVVFATAPALISTGTFDITNNYVVVSGAAGSLTTWQTAARNGRLMTSTAPPPAVSGGQSTVGVAIVTGAQFLSANGAGALFDHTAVNPGDLLFRLTYHGDANLDGQISLNDYLALDTGYRFGGNDWARGDFNHDGLVSAADYALTDNNYHYQNGALSDQMIVLHATWFGADYLTSFTDLSPEVVAAVNAELGIMTVPEPATLTWLALGGVGLAALRRGARRR